VHDHKDFTLQLFVYLQLQCLYTVGLGQEGHPACNILYSAVPKDLESAQPGVISAK